MKLKNFKSRFIFGAVGILIMSFAVALSINLNLGLYPPETLNLVLGDWLIDYLHWNVDPAWLTTWIAIFYNAIFLLFLIPLRIYFKRLNWRILFLLIPTFLFSIPLGFFLNWIDHWPFSITALSWGVKLVTFILVFLVSNFGNAMYQVANVANFPMNDFTEDMAQFSRLRFGIIRMIIDGVTLTLALTFFWFFQLPSSYIGVMTLFLILGTGPVLDFFISFLRRNFL